MNEEKDRASLIHDMACNISQRDREFLKEGYIPIAWLLANLSYEEASFLMYLSQKVEI